MLAVHWTPVNNTKHILRNGIAKSKTGLYCFPLTGHHSLDRWWIYFFNQCRVRLRKSYNGIVFRLEESDMPAYLGHWGGATISDVFEKPFQTLKDLQKNFRETIIWRFGEMIACERNIAWHKRNDELLFKLANQEMQKSPKIIVNAMNDVSFMTYTLEDYQIVLSNSIPAKRIIKIIPQSTEFGRVIRMNKKYKVKN